MLNIEYSIHFLIYKAYYFRFFFQNSITFSICLSLNIETFPRNSVLETFVERDPACLSEFIPGLISIYSDLIPRPYSHTCIQKGYENIFAFYTERRDDRATGD